MKASKGIGIGIAMSVSRLGNKTLGANVVIDGDFTDGGTAWYSTGGSTVNTGVARIYSASGSVSYISQAGVLEAGKIYRVEYDIVDVTIQGGGLVNNGGTQAWPSTLGHHIVDYTSPSDFISFKRYSGITDITIDNITAKEIL